MSELDQLRTLRQDLAGDPASLSRARHRLHEQTTKTQRVRRRHPRRAVLAAAAVAVAASVAGAVVVAGLPVFDDTPTGASPAAAAVLDEAARNAGKAVPVKARAGQYLYRRTHEWVLFGGFYPSRKVPEGTPVKADRLAYYLSENVHEIWRPVENNHATLIRKTEGLRRRPLRPADVQNLKDAGVNLNRPPDTWFSPDPADPKDRPTSPVSGPAAADPFYNPTPATLATLPTDPDKLLATIRRHAEGRGPSRDGEALSVIADLFRAAELLIEPDLRAALFRAAAKIPGLERRPGQVNLDGQPGVAIGRAEAAHGARKEIIVDPVTSRVIGERTVVVAKPAPPTQGPSTANENTIPIGTVTGWTATRSAVVDRSGQTTPAR